MAHFAGLQAHRKRRKSARASPTLHHTFSEERSARFIAQPLSPLGNCFCIRIVYSIKLRLIVMPTIWNIEQGKDREKENVDGRSPKLSEKKGDRDLERERKKKQTKETFFFGNMKIL